MSTEYWKNLPLAWMQTTPPMMMKPGRAQIDGWEQLVHQTLAAQAEWSGEFTQRLRTNAMVPSGAISLVEQAQSSSERLIHFQDELWQRWFQWLRTYTDDPAELDRPTAAAEASDAATVTVQTAAHHAAAEEKPDAVEDHPPINDLTALRGVGPAIANKLNEAGVICFAQIANWTDSDIERIEETVLGGRFVGRIRRDGWIEQAKELIGGHG